MTRIAIPALTVLLAVAAFVGLAGWNRSLESQPPLTLTERELVLPFRPVNVDDGAGVQLQLQFEPRHEPLDARNWLPESRLRALGFTLNVPAGDPAAAEVYTKVPSRVVWVVLEYNGAAFQEVERRRALRRQSETWFDRRPPSRLVPVDAGLDVDALRARYRDGHLIVRGIVSLSYSSDALIYATLRGLVPARVTVPRALVPVLHGLVPRLASDDPADQRSSAELAPRYEVDVAVGRLGIPFIRSIRRLGA
jgi:hypothetical protein